MKKIILTFIALGTLAACESVPVNQDPQYWERKSVSESVYLRGPKAQQTLNRDIARCVTELRELERLGQLKNAIPPDPYSKIDSLEELERLDYDTPEHDANLLAEHGNYHNLQDCMKSKGWQRTANVPFDVALRAQETYRANHVLHNKKAQSQRDLEQEKNTSGLNS